MNLYLSIIKYYPESFRDEGFGIGIILFSEDGLVSKVRVSEERIKRINKAYEFKMSELLKFTLEEIKGKSFNKKLLDYLSVYENGTIRYTKPQPIQFDNLDTKFDELYIKFAADLYEYETTSTKVKKVVKLGHRFRKSLATLPTIAEHLSVGYNFSQDDELKIHIGCVKIDYIGINSVIFAGEILNLDLNEDTLQASFSKTITLFDALGRFFPSNFAPELCRFLILKEHAENPEKALYMDILHNWEAKAGYKVLIKEKLDDFSKLIASEASEKKTMPFDRWLVRQNGIPLLDVNWN